MEYVGKRLARRSALIVVTVILMTIPVMMLCLNGLTAKAGEVMLEDRYGADLLDQRPFDFYSGSSRYGMRAYFADNKPVFGLEPGKLLYDKSLGSQALYPEGGELPLEMTEEQSKLLYYALISAGATEDCGKDISPGSYAMAQASVWAVMSGQYTTVDDFREHMEELGDHLAREEWRPAFLDCLTKYCAQIEGACARDAIPIFASEYEAKAPVHKMAAREDGNYSITLETNGEWQQTSLAYDMPEGWEFRYDGSKVIFLCKNGRPDSGVITGYFPWEVEAARNWIRPAAISVIEPLGEDRDLKQTVLCWAKKEKPWAVYLQFTGGGESSDGTYRLEYHRYSHDEVWEADYGAELDKYCSETGKPLEDAGFQILDGFDLTQLERTGLDSTQFSGEEIKACVPLVYTDSVGKAYHHDKETYRYKRTYCGGHPKPQILKLTAGEGALEEEKEAIAERNEKAKRDGENAWKECIEWCEKNCDFHSVDDSAKIKLAEERQARYSEFTGLKKKYVVKETIARQGYILHGLHGDDNIIEAMEVPPLQDNGKGVAGKEKKSGGESRDDVKGDNRDYSNGNGSNEKEGSPAKASDENPHLTVMKTLKTTPSDGTQNRRKATPGSAWPDDGADDVFRPDRASWSWGDILEKSSIYPIDQKKNKDQWKKAIFKVEGHRTEGELHINKQDLELYNKHAPNSIGTGGYKKTQGDATLEGAVYGLYADENIVHPDGKTGIVFSRGELVSIAATNQDGNASFVCITEESQTSKNVDNLLEENKTFNGSQWIGAPLLLGNYYVKEISRSEGYELSQYGKDLPDSNQNADIVDSSKKGSVEVAQLPRRTNGWDGSWEEFKVSFFNTDSIEILAGGFPIDASFAKVQRQVRTVKEQRTAVQSVVVKNQKVGKPISKKGDNASEDLAEPEQEGFLAAMYITPVLSGDIENRATLSNALPMEKRELKSGRKQRNVHDHIKEKAMALLKEAGYKKCTDKYPWEILLLEGETEEEMADEIYRWCRENSIWDAFKVEDVFEKNGNTYGVIRYGYSVLEGQGAVFHPGFNQLIVKKTWDQGFYYIVYDTADYIRNGMYFIVEKREADKKTDGWDAIEPEPVYKKQVVFEVNNTVRSDEEDKLRTEVKAGKQFETVTEEYGKEELIPLKKITYDYTHNCHRLVVDTSDIDWKIQGEPVEIIIRVSMPSNVIEMEGEVMTAGDHRRRYSSVGYSITEIDKSYDHGKTYIEKAVLRYQGGHRIYEDYTVEELGTRYEPLSVLERVIKQPIKIEKVIDKNSYDQNHTYKIHKDPFTEHMGGYNGRPPALSFNGFLFRCFLKSDIEQTGLLHKKKDGQPDYERFFNENIPFSYLMALDWKVPDGDWDRSLKVICADKIEEGPDGSKSYFGVSQPMPYGTYVIQELPPLGFPNNSYQIDKPREITIPFVSKNGGGGDMNDGPPSKEYLYDAAMETEEMEQKYYIRFQEEAHVIRAHNSDGDFPVYKYGANTDIFSQPYPNPGVGEYYKFGASEKKGMEDSVYYETYIDRDGMEAGRHITKKNVPSMTGKTRAVDRLYAPALVPWSILAPGVNGRLQPEHSNGVFNFVSYANRPVVNSLYAAKIRIQKKDGKTGKNIFHGEAVFQIFAAERDVKADEAGNISGTGKVIFDEEGLPVYNEKEPIILKDKEGHVTETVKFFPGENGGYYETCQPLGSGVYVLREKQAPDGYVTGKPVAIEIYSDQVFYYKNGDSNDRVRAELVALPGYMEEAADLWQIEIENMPTEISIHKIERGEGTKYVPGAEMCLYQGICLKEKENHQYEGVEVIRRADGTVMDILYRLPESDEGKKSGRKVFLWRYDIGGKDVMTDEETGVSYGLNKNGAPICMIDSETGMAFVYDRNKNRIAYPVENGRKIPAKVWEEIGDGKGDKKETGKEKDVRWETEKEGYLIRKIPCGFYIVEEENVPYQDGYVQALSMGIQVKETAGHQKYVMEDGHTSYEVSIVDSSSHEKVKEAEMTLYLAEKVTDNSSKGYHLEKLLDEEEKPIPYKSWISSDQNYRMERIPVGNYVLEETKVPYGQGYTQSGPMEVMIDDREGVQKTVMEADHTLLEVQKLDKMTGKPVTGEGFATLALYQARLGEDGKPIAVEGGKEGYEHGKLILQWKTGGKKERAVDNYNESRKKIPLPSTARGFYFVTEEGHTRFEYLPIGYYVLVEETAPSGYASTSPILIHILDEGNLNKIHLARMADAPLSAVVSKLGIDDTDSLELSGALLSLFERKPDGSRGELVCSWKSGMDGRYTEEDKMRGQIPTEYQVGDWKPHTISYLKKGEYILAEERAPFGWMRAEDIVFQIEDDEEPVKLLMKDQAVRGQVKVRKTDDSGIKGLSGAEFLVKNQQTGQEVCLITDENGYGYSGYLPVGQMDEKGEFIPYTYEITEQKAPDGYIKENGIHEFQFTYVDDLHPLLIYFYPASNRMKQVKISKLYKKTGKYLSGAQLQVVDKKTGGIIDQWISSLQPHYINGISEGVYRLEEAQTPGAGYKKAKPIDFAVPDQQEKVISLTMYDEHTTLVAEKRAADTGKILAGALMELARMGGETVDVWVTDSQARVFYGLEPGEYILSEIKSPAGYELAKPVMFTLEDRLGEQKIVVTDSRLRSPAGGGGEGKKEGPPDNTRAGTVIKTGYITASYHPEEVGSKGWLENAKASFRRWAKLPGTGEGEGIPEALSLIGILLGAAIAIVVRKKKGRKHLILVIAVGASMTLAFGRTDSFAEQIDQAREVVELQQNGQVMKREYWQREDSDPEEWFVSDEGVYYHLTEWERQPEIVSERIKEVYGQITYDGIEKSRGVPKMTEIEVADEESQTHFSSQVPLVQCEFLDEVWSDDFQFQMTFHEYGADNYRLEEKEIIISGEEPYWNGCEEELLSMIGVGADDYKILSIQWSGEPYTAADGERCRDAVAAGKKKVWNCVAGYGGEVKLPDLEGYRYHALYKIWEEETVKKEEKNLTTTEPFSKQEKEEKDIAGKGNIWGALKTYVILSVGIAAVILVFVAIRLLWIYLKMKKERRKRE